MLELKNKIAVTATGDSMQAIAKELAGQLHLPFIYDDHVSYPFWLTVTPKRLELQERSVKKSKPIYVDFLAIPYQAADVVEWDYRYRMASYFYQKPNCDLLAKISDQGVTQVVLPSDYALACPEMMEVYEDSAYKLYRLTP